MIGPARPGCRGDPCRCHAPPQGLEPFTSLQSLSLSCCQLRKLTPGCFPGSLTSLILSDNALTASSLEALTQLTNLQHLDIAGNRIAKLEQLSPLTALRQLTSLDTVGCPLEDSTPDYTSKVFEMLSVLPAFNYLNGMDRLGNGQCACHHHAAIFKLWGLGVWPPGAAGQPSLVGLAVFEGLLNSGRCMKATAGQQRSRRWRGAGQDSHSLSQRPPPAAPCCAAEKAVDEEVDGEGSEEGSEYEEEAEEIEEVSLCCCAVLW